MQRLFARARLVLSGVLALLLAPLAALAATLPATPDTLAAALRASAGGDTIALACGTYAHVDIRNLVRVPAIVIQPADPACRPVLKAFQTLNSRGVTFRGLEFSNAGQTGYYAWGVINSADIHFDRLDVHGSLDGNPQNDIEGIGFTGSTRISVTNSEFHELYRSIAIGKGDQVTITGNAFHDIARSGIFGQDASNVLIAANTFHDFFPRPGDHMDAIAFYNTLAGYSHDVTVSGNRAWRGRGTVTQGIFLASPHGMQTFRNLVVADNLIVGEGYNGLAVSGVAGLTLTGNRVLSFLDQLSWIDVKSTTGGEISGNQASQLPSGTANGNLGLTLGGNLLVPRVTDGGAAALGATGAGVPPTANTFH